MTTKSPNRCGGTGWLDASYPSRVCNSPAAEDYERPCEGCEDCEPSDDECIEKGEDYDG